MPEKHGRQPANYLLSPDFQNIFPPRGVARCAPLLFHGPDPLVSCHTRAGHMQGPPPKALVDGIHGRHESAPVGYLVILQIQLDLLTGRILKVQQHHTRLGQLEAWVVYSS